MAKKKTKSSVPAKFHVGDKVLVKHGIKDVEYPDMPLGGWAGTIAEVHRDGMYTVRWSGETLAAIHPVFKKRCERDGLVLEDYWLGDDDLEPDEGGPLKIEHPQKITTKPLSAKDPDDRVRMIFGLTSNDPLPEVDEETQVTYHKYLSENLVFPFEAMFQPEHGSPLRITVTGLSDPDEEPDYIDETYGLLCDARIGNRKIVVPLGELEVPRGKPDRQLISDYTSWLWS